VSESYKKVKKLRNQYYAWFLFFLMTVFWLFVHILVFHLPLDVISALYGMMLTFCVAMMAFIENEIDKILQKREES